MMHGKNVEVELTLPLDEMVADRLQGFYNAIGWVAAKSPEGDNRWSVGPGHGDDPDLPRVVYRLTQEPDYAYQFSWNTIDSPSAFSMGWRLPGLQFVVSVGLLVPSSRDVQDIWDGGGDLLKRHGHIPPEIDEGRRRFFFNDPFNYSLQVTSSQPDTGVVSLPVTPPDPPVLPEPELLRPIGMPDQEG